MFFFVKIQPKLLIFNVSCGFCPKLFKDGSLVSSFVHVSNCTKIVDYCLQSVLVDQLVFDVIITSNLYNCNHCLPASGSLRNSAPFLSLPESLR